MAKTSSRSERRAALRAMLKLSERQEYLLREATRMINDENALDREKLINEYLAEMSAIGTETTRSNLMRPYSEADFLDKIAVLPSIRPRDFILLVLTLSSAIAVILTVLRSKLVEEIGRAFSNVFGVLPAAAAEPDLLLNPLYLRQVVVLVFGAVLVVLIFMFGVTWMVSKDGAKRREARDFLTTILTFLVGVLAGQFV